MKKFLFMTIVLLSIFSLILSGCTTNPAVDDKASGTLTAVQVSIAPEVGGKVVEVLVREGDSIKAGDVLLKMDSELLQAQIAQAEAAEKAAAATVTAAEKQLEYAQNQYDLALQGARAQSTESRMKAWKAEIEKDFKPAWYFQKTEKLEAIRSEIETADKDLQTKLANLEREMKNAGNQDFIDAEKRLDTAETAYAIALKAQEQAKGVSHEKITDAAQSLVDQAKAEFDAALKKYDSLLSSSSADNLLKARAEVAIAQARVDYAQDALSALETGEQSRQVAVVKTVVEQAKAAIDQANANQNQAKAALDLLKLQLDRTEVKAAMDGIVLNRNIENGELVAPGGSVMTIARLDEITLTVYLPENQYGKVSLNDKVKVKVDSFPNQMFTGTVTYISDKAEFTPRNVQTVESRSATVYAVKIVLENKDGKLKPGMPADVEF